MFFSKPVRWTVTLLLAGFPLSLAHAAELESAIRFNTTCAQCHEGECSGRLSFALGKEAAFDHIRRYAGEVDAATTLYLFDALARMKTDCAFAPMPVLSLQQPAQSSELDTYRNPGTGAYFVPIGTLQPGHYRLDLQLQTPASFRVEVINEFFELVEETCAGPSVQHQAIDFMVEEQARHYVRLRSPRPLSLKSMGWLK
jgi:hypothetical protein